MIIADDDTVEITNLQRQIAHGQSNLGEAKVQSALTTLKGLNPNVRITPLQQRLTATELDEIVPTATLVLDACDNFTTRFELNQACVRHRVPLVSGAAIRVEGQAACAGNGVMAPVVGIIGAVQAIEHPSAE